MWYLNNYYLIFALLKFCVGIWDFAHEIANNKSTSVGINKDNVVA